MSFLLSAPGMPVSDLGKSVNLQPLPLARMDEKISVLIIEDEESWMLALQLLLESLGFEVAAVASTVEDAIQAINTTTFDIALIDINLGTANSGILLGQLVRNTLQKPFVFITASGATHTLNEAAKARPSAYLLKPADKTALYIAIQNALENSTGGKTDLTTSEHRNDDNFFTKRGKKYVKVFWKDVISLTSDQKYTMLDLLGDDHTCYIRSSLQNTIRHILPASISGHYIQISRGQYINLQHVVELNDCMLVTSNKKQYAVSENYLAALKKKLNIMV